MRIKQELARLSLQTALRVSTGALTWAHLVIALTAGAYALFAVGMLVVPWLLEPLTGLGLEGVGAATEVRAIYGGLQLAVSLVVVAWALDPRRAVSAATMAIAFTAGSAAGRFLGLALEPEALGLHIAFGVAEVLAAVLCVLARSHLVRTRRAVSERTSADQGPAHPNPTRPEHFRPLARDNVASPYAFYEAMRTHQPVYKIPGTDYFCVSRYEDVRAIALDPETYSSNLVAILLSSADGEARAVRLPGRKAGPVDVLAIQDPPRHGTQRKVTASAMTTRFQRSLDDDVRKLARALVAPLVARGQGDWMEEVAFVLPMRIALQLVGFPERDHDQVKAWCDHAVALLSGVNSPEEMAEHMAVGIELYDYIVKQFEVARESGEDHVVAALVQAVDAGEMTGGEALSIVLQVLIAGSDSSASTMGSAMHRLVHDLPLQQQLRADPALIAPFVEEVLRLESPFQGHFRITTRDTEVAGVPLPKGTRLMLMWASANRDPDKFAAPDALDLGRANAKAHLAFGHGIHHCLGAPLARLEIRVAIEEVLSASAQLVPGAGDIEFRHSVFVRTIEALPIRVAEERSPRCVGGCVVQADDENGNDGLDDDADHDLALEHVVGGQAKRPGNAPDEHGEHQEAQELGGWGHERGAVREADSDAGPYAGVVAERVVDDRAGFRDAEPRYAALEASAQCDECEQTGQDACGDEHVVALQYR
jgi:cytochrome P450